MSLDATENYILLTPMLGERNSNYIGSKWHEYDQNW